MLYIVEHFTRKKLIGSMHDCINAVVKCLKMLQVQILLCCMQKEPGNYTLVIETKVF